MRTMTKEANQASIAVVQSAIEQHREFLEERIDQDSGLLDKLLANGTLSRKEHSEVKGKSSLYERNAVLLDYILKEHRSEFLIRALLDTEQKHIVNYLNANAEYMSEFGGEWPLTKNEISILDTNQESLVELLELTDLLGHLYSSKVVNKRQMVSISSESNPFKKNEAVIEILRRRSLNDFRNTITCLERTNQRHIAEILDKGGAVVRVHVKLNGGDVDQTEDEIISRFKAVLLSKPAEERNRLLADIQVIAAQKGQSVVLYFYCKTLTALVELRDMQISGKLNTAIERLFNQLLSPAQYSEVTVDNLKSVVESKFTQLLHRSQITNLKLTLSESEYKKSRSIFPDDITLRAIQDFDSEWMSNRERKKFKESLQLQRDRRMTLEYREEHVVEGYYSDDEVNPYATALSFKRGDKMKTIHSANIGDIVGWWMVKHLDNGQMGFVPRNCVLIDLVAAEQPVKTTINKLPLELLDIILQKSFLLYTLSGEQSTEKVCEFTRLSSVDFCWFQRLIKRSFKKIIWCHLSKFYEEFHTGIAIVGSSRLYLEDNIQSKEFYEEFRRGIVIFRSNGSYLEENIQPNCLISRLRYANCLTDVETRLLSRQRLIKSTKKLFRKNNNPDLLHVVRSFDDAKRSDFFRCLRKSKQNLTTRVAENGGVVLKTIIVNPYKMKRQSLDQRINDLRDKTKPRSHQTEKLIIRLKDADIEILNSVLDRQTVVWIWCQSHKGLEKIQKLNESNSLIHMFTELTLLSSPTESSKTIAVSICRDQLKKNVVMCPISIRFIKRLDMGTYEEIKGVTKLRNEIYVLSYSVIRVFEDHNPFSLQEELEINEIKCPQDIGSSEKESCLYVIDSHEKCVWKITRETNAQHKIIKWLTTDYKPTTLSVSSDGHLLMTYGYPPIQVTSSFLEIYGSDAELLRSIQLPKNIWNPIHAVETSIGNFIILHWWKKKEEEGGSWSGGSGDEKCIVDEVTTDGQMVVRRVIRSHKTQQLRYPRYLSLASDDQVLVADTGNYRVVLLDSDLKWNQILCPTKAEENFIWPEKLCYDEENKLLIVSVYDGIDVYSFNRK